MSKRRYGADIPIEIHLLTPETVKYTQRFFCDYESVDTYLRYEAPYDPTAVTYLFVDTEMDMLVAYVTIACSAIFNKEQKEEEEFPQIKELMDPELEEDENRPYSTILSAMEIKFFAVDEKYKHLPYRKNAKHTLSHYIMMYMLNKMWNLSHDAVGAAKVVLYSVPEAVRFYKRCSFKEFGDTMYGDKGSFVGGCVPMYFDLN